MVMLAAAVALVATDAHFEGRADARLETRARTSTYADASGPNSAAADAEVTPTFFGSMENLGGRLALSYSPSLRFREPYENFSRYEFNNTQTLEADWSREGRPRFYLLETFYQGRVDLATQPVATPFRVGVVNQASIDVNAGVVWPLSKRVSLDTSAGFNFGAGLDSYSLTYMPAQRAWRSRARLESLLSGVDSLIGTFEGNHTDFPGIGSTFTTGSIDARWRRQLLATTTLDLGLLAGIISGHVPQSDIVPAATLLTVVPGGDAVVTHHVGSGPHALSFDAGLRVAPFVDRYLASAYDRGEVATTVAYVFRERWALSGHAAVARSLTPVRVLYDPSPTDIFSTFVEARAGYIAPRWWRLELTGMDSTFWVGQGAPVNNWLVGLAFTVHAEGQL
jgi:hypothetical protein